VSGINWTVATGVGYWFYGATPRVEEVTRTGMGRSGRIGRHSRAHRHVHHDLASITEQCR
jgi:hypothetical protein